MMKIEKEQKIKREYIPVVLAGLILILFATLLVLTINYEPDLTDEINDSEIVENEDLALEKTESKCNTKELQEIVNSAAKISATYSAQEKTIPAPEEIATDPNMEQDEFIYRYLELLIKGITDDIYIEITNNYNNDKKVIKPEEANKNGEYRYEAPTMDVLVTYTVSVYANKYDCAGEVVRKVVFDTRIYNSFKNMLACVMYPNYEKCTTFVTEQLSYDEFFNGLDNYIDKHKGTEDEATANIMNAFLEGNIVTAEDIRADALVSNKKGIKKAFEKIKNNLEFIIIAGVIISIGGLVVVLLIFIRRNKL
ncbi:MAG: hypothetical protein J1F35_01785 [Erysipelotrichales bacterium]|nr:hypothetical protein [Erysipelotrichales bacterium]